MAHGDVGSASHAVWGSDMQTFCRNRKVTLTHREIANIMTARGYPMSRAAVQHTEIRALHKLKQLLIDNEQEDQD